jgi:gamma-glutamyltranspeptidase/glutathione hydrolase
MSTVRRSSSPADRADACETTVNGVAAVAAADGRAAAAGAELLGAGGSAVDAAIAANAVMAVVAPNLCGLGGDLFAVVYDGGSVLALNSSGPAGSRADPARLRAEGHHQMPFRHDARSVTVPGCVDGWVALHDRFGRRPLGEVLAPAMQLAEYGYEARQDLVDAIDGLDERGRQALAELADQAVARGATIVLPRLARVLGDIIGAGRDGFYLGAFGEGLAHLDGGDISRADLERNCAEWVTPLRATAFDHVLHTVPPNSQGYLAIAAAAIASRLDVDADSTDPLWPHLLIEAAMVAGHDRLERLHEAADGPTLVDELVARADQINGDRTCAAGGPTHSGDTTYLCAIDATGQAVSLIQSNASGFGSWLAEPNTGINLQNRGVGFSLRAGHPTELGAGRRPAHTLMPLLVTNLDGGLVGVLGAAGGDGQPQTTLQMLARILVGGESAATAVAAPRWVLRRGDSGFDTWDGDARMSVLIEANAPPRWADGLRARGHHVEVVAAHAGAFGHAHAIIVDEGGNLDAAADPRAERSGVTFAVAGRAT